MAKITYEDKEFLNKNESIADKNKVNDTDLNQIKEVINTNDDNIGDLSNLNTSDKSNLVNALNEINNKNLKKLWENTNTTNEFAPQDITLSSSDYDYYIIFAFNANTTIGADLPNYGISYFSPKGKGVQFMSWYNNAMNSRSIAYVNETTLHANANYRQSPGGTSNANNNYLIPYQVYGGKF